MANIRFITEIGNDQMIRLPAGVCVTPGTAEVIVLQGEEAMRQPLSGDEEFPAGVPEIAKDLARFARAQNGHGLPPDLALHHDHYLHGSPKGIDQL